MLFNRHHLKNMSDNNSNNSKVISGKVTNKTHIPLFDPLGDENLTILESGNYKGHLTNHKNDPITIKKMNRTLNNILILLIIAVILLAVIAISFVYVALLIQSIKTDIYTSIDIKTLGANLDSTMANMKTLSADPITASMGLDAKDQIQTVVQVVSQISVSGQSEFNSTANKQLVQDVFELLGRTAIYYNSTLNDFSNYEPKIMTTVDKFLTVMTRFSQALGMMFVAPPPAPTP